MKIFYYKNGNTTNFENIEPESISLSGNKKHIKENLIVQRIPRIIFILLLIIFVITLLFFIIFKIKVSHDINIEYNKYVSENNENLDIHEIKKLNDINYIKSFQLIGTNISEVQTHFEYMDKAKSGIYLKEENLVKSENPKVSVIIALYNRENYIKATIRSIQNQNLKELEIVIIDDMSSDNSIKIVKEEQKKDPRIVLYQNKINMGTLYSKSIGVLKAKGKYVHSLDSDDMMCSENYLQILYDEAEKGHYKFIQAKALYVDLNSKIITKSTPNWMVLWAKLIRTDFYRNAVYSVGYNALNNKVVVLYDDIVSVFIINHGKNTKIRIIGVSHFTHPGNHVFFNRFSDRENMKKYCLSMVNTINAFYKILNRNIGKNYGNFLLKSHFYGGICSYFKKKEPIKELLEQYQKEKEKEKEKGKEEVKQQKT